MIQYVDLIISGVLLNALVQVFLRKGMVTISYLEFSAVNSIPIALV